MLMSFYHLTTDAMQLLLSQPDKSTPKGRRDIKQSGLGQASGTGNLKFTPCRAYSAGLIAVKKIRCKIITPTTDSISF
jgi:hypothetical protein